MPWCAACSSSVNACVFANDSVDARCSASAAACSASHAAFAAACVAVTLGVTFFDINQYNDGTAGIQDRLGLFFFILIYFSLMSLSSLPIWRDEQRIFIHERAAGAYGTLAYFTANIVCDLITYRILPPAVFTAIW